jgi:cellulose synthase/poly-beta-1,6-N-acetylglucosamine synthase-like glycosyltransferase
MSVFFVAFARDSAGVRRKAAELDKLGYRYVIVCGERMDLPNVVHREPQGKYDAVNFSIGLIPITTDLVVFNDVDTTIHNFDAGLSVFKDKTISLACARVAVERGPQISFYALLDRLRNWLPIAASGELMLIRYKTLKNIMPLRPCKAEDTYMLFKVLERGEKVFFSNECYVETKRTQRSRDEEQYKRRTVGGIYQALLLTKAPAIIRFFYAILPFISPLLLFFGKRGYYWTKGILLGIFDSIKGDQSGTWPADLEVELPQNCETFF